jgi:hypothetical protein
MTFDFDDETRFPMFAVEPTSGGGVDNAAAPRAEEAEEEEEPEAAELETEKTRHA